MLFDTDEAMTMRHAITEEVTGHITSLYAADPSGDRFQCRLVEMLEVGLAAHISCHSGRPDPFAEHIGLHKLLPGPLAKRQAGGRGFLQPSEHQPLQGTIGTYYYMYWYILLHIATYCYILLHIATYCSYCYILLHIVLVY